MVPVDIMVDFGAMTAGALARPASSLLSNDFFFSSNTWDLIVVDGFATTGFGLAGLGGLAKASSARAFVTR